MTPSVAAPGVIHPSDATVPFIIIIIIIIHYHHVYLLKKNNNTMASKTNVIYKIL